MALPLESVHEQIGAKLRNVLASINHEATPQAWWHTPDRVVRVDEFLIDHLRKDFSAMPTVYQIRPGDEFVREMGNKQVDRDAEIFVLAARSYSWPVKKGHFGNDKLAEGILQDGTRDLVVLAPPRDPAPVRLTVTKPQGGSLTGSVSVTGLDHSGAALTVTFDLATGLEQYSSDALASATTVSLTSIAGTAADDSLKLEWFLPKWTVQNRLVRDVVKKILEDIRLGDLTYNLEIPDINRDFDIEVSGTTWAVVELRLVAKYRHHVNTP
jgi:hypothetical protein